MTTTNKKTDFYQVVTDQIIEALEQGIKPWQCPWDVTQASGIPSNFSTQNDYQGMNVMLLWMSAQMNRFSSPQWLTFKQSKALGGKVRKGEKGTHIFFYKVVEKKNSAPGQEEKETYSCLKTYVVFNLDQIEGVEQADTPVVNVRDDVTLIDEVETFLVSTGASISYSGQKAFFRPSTDEIVIPERSRFSENADLYATIMHELTHWTGHKSRLDRDNKGSFGSKDYAFEELIAEIGAAFLMADFGIVGNVQHESYIASWLEVLKNDKRYVFKAATQASKAHQLLKEFVNLEVSKAA
ncbi:zincin-like metallopeptidase domain-containing protein [Vibrio tapetis subsp. quintayensis]|uniref:ArdC family protein n=1 Tax=Vibrio tapetis TaxID=52443 RepID=UPI0025B406E3|nr:zincin-like metallopeptidase domain-containing protein [Vibrio tapetis]MDN3683224.1 zincin-like metallopeptidase domain-containing protein [Vibrio tapetis subsp. quintayensis]